MDAELWVVCLCAQWCHICRDLAPGFAQLPDAHPGVRWHWVDIEDDEHLLGDLDVDTFPTYLIAAEDGVRLFAPGPNQADALAHFVRPYASGQVAARAHDPAVWQTFQAIKAQANCP